MAQKQKKRKSKRGGLRTVLFYLLFPLLVWFVAFLIWFYWHNLTGLFGQSEQSAKPIGRSERKVERGSSAPASQPKEKLFDEDRKKLDEILKQRQ